MLIMGTEESSNCFATMDNPLAESCWHYLQRAPVARSFICGGVGSVIFIKDEVAVVNTGRFNRTNF